MRTFAATQTRPVERVIEILAVLLLGIATVGSAWCGYQATRWNDKEGDLARAASDVRIEGARLFSLATQRVSYDANIVAQYAQALASGDQRLQQFYRTTLVRPDFLPILDEWQAQAAGGTGSPPNLLQNQAYMDAQFADYRAADARAEELSRESDEASRNGSAFVLTTLLLAMALFFAGVTTTFKIRFARIALLAGAGLTICFAAARVASLPVV